jgi:hypothetical protein
VKRAPVQQNESDTEKCQQRTRCREAGFYSCAKAGTRGEVCQAKLVPRNDDAFPRNQNVPRNKAGVPGNYRPIPRNCQGVPRSILVPGNELAVSRNLAI